MPFKLSSDVLDDIATLRSSLETRYSPDALSVREYLVAYAGRCTGCSGNCIGDCSGTCRGCTNHYCQLQ